MARVRSTAARKGDIVEVSGHHVGDRPRVGEILQVLGGAERPHYRVRWEDGGETIFYPSNDAIIRPKLVPR